MTVARHNRDPVGVPSRPAGNHAARPWLDPEQPTRNRVVDLLAAMTLEEKVAQCGALWVDEHESDVPAFAAAVSGDLQGLDLEARIPHGIGHLTRPYGSSPLPVDQASRAVAAIQGWLVHDTRLGIPALVHEECLTGLMAPGATVMPAPLNWGASFDPDVVEELAAVIAEQLATLDVHLGLAPVLDVIRDHRWGRTEECISEDPYLVAVLGAAYVRGLQRDGRVLATVKHFLGHGSPEAGHNTAPVHAGPREVADTFAPPFETAVRLAGAGAVMSAYHDLDGMPVTADPSLLTALLRDRWGFTGLVVSDYWALDFLRHHHHVAASVEDAAVAAFAAGVDVELPGTVHSPSLVDAVRAGRLGEDVVDRACGRVLAAKFALGLFDRPPRPARPGTVLDTPAARAAARRAAERSVTLLTNDGTLPLSDRFCRIAVVGPSAADGGCLLGNYTYRHHVAYRFGASDPLVVPHLLTALREALPTDVDLVTAPGCAVTGDDATGIDAAVAAARGADVCLAVVGDRAGHLGRGTVGEGTDASSLSLPGGQVRLLDALAHTGTPLVVVHVAGRPHDLSTVVAAASAIVTAWFPGEEGAAALADVLLGRADPAGRTPVSFTRGAGHQPGWYGARPLARQDYVDAPAAALFPFGHGLSYTTFAYEELELPARVGTDGTLTVRCRVTNTGRRPGHEVVQLYVSDPVASVTRPPLELRGFGRLHLDPGDAVAITFALPVALCSFTGATGERVVEPGDLVVSVGASSADLRLTGTVTVEGPRLVVGDDRPLVCPVTAAPAPAAAAAGQAPAREG